MTMCPEKSPREGMSAPKVNVAKILQWLHYMYKMNNIPIQMNGFSHTMMKNGKHLNHQIQSTIDIFKRQLAHIYSIFIGNYAHWEI